MTSSLASANWVRPWTSAGCGISSGSGSAIGPVRSSWVHTDVDPLDVEHVADVDVDDARVGVGRAQDGGVEHALADQHVVGVPALPAEEALVLDARDLGAEQLGRHGVTGSLRAISAARSTALTMFW